MSENEVQLNLNPSPFVGEEYTRWSVEDVVKWCIFSLELQDEDPLVDQLRKNAINGELLGELTLEDCKELCEDDLSLAIRFKVLCNRLQQGVNGDTKLQEQQENMIVALKNLHSAISQKLQEFQSQYTRLRGDVLEVVKTSNSSPKPPSQQQFAYQQQAAGSDYFDTTHHGGEFATGQATPHGISRKMSGHSVKPANPSRSTSSHLVNETLAPSQASQQVSSEPLKQLRASKEDSCERILKNAMKRHNLSDQDWRGYVLVICYGDQERVLDLDEKPVVIFKNLKQQGLHPAIMLRRRGDFAEVDTEGNVTPGGRL
ncbi:hypothetical protein ZYGR_0W00630 [Zygosaccharomyces rouxii]|uniref:ZYRO0F17644p n=2 Tax=Zygosaccharomyces rouxii TaxID=4956 RepID=C5DZ24_ZYGRC|nr:uncharacterized protein ZYRO0F17644g [Zygosaccharomyces rouxii]KAH9201253.1 protein STE50 [Zygosaccharomyces rouxii]GAV50537.1 hypothetical protein ZYGR_0W00630 [Zygosaccharomyces rouxii]CAQ43339.1 Protein STE50 [Zygosaccharomyces rouxii]CAR29035.1 ZYRO0F17644p [Zygosaccharomyces rouxii]